MKILKVFWQGYSVIYHRLGKSLTLDRIIVLGPVFACSEGQAYIQCSNVWHLDISFVCSILQRTSNVTQFVQIVEM